MIIHGRRMPSRDAVRSLSLPKNGLPTIATKAPIPATSAKLPGARSIPTSESTFNAKVTSKGAMNNRLVLMYANAYSEIKPQPDPVCRGRPGLQRSLGCGSVLQSAPRSTRPGRSPANRPTRDDMMIRKAMVIPPRAP